MPRVLPVHLLYGAKRSRFFASHEGAEALDGLDTITAEALTSKGGFFDGYSFCVPSVLAAI